ncbi:hypothetical protein IMY05_002G0157300 [Salix suchowensis]|nr:hypothetical protein IMY05_002G0157300 [Salix suchowensis]
MGIGETRGRKWTVVEEGRHTEQTCGRVTGSKTKIAYKSAKQNSVPYLSSSFTFTYKKLKFSKG